MLHTLTFSVFTQWSPNLLLIRRAAVSALIQQTIVAVCSVWSRSQELISLAYRED